MTDATQRILGMLFLRGWSDRFCETTEKECQDNGGRKGRLQRWPDVVCGIVVHLVGYYSALIFGQ